MWPLKTEGHANQDSVECCVFAESCSLFLSPKLGVTAHLSASSPTICAIPYAQCVCAGCQNVLRKRQRGAHMTVLYLCLMETLRAKNNVCCARKRCHASRPRTTLVARTVASVRESSLFSLKHVRGHARSARAVAMTPVRKTSIPWALPSTTYTIWRQLPSPYIVRCTRRIWGVKMSSYVSVMK